MDSTARPCTEASGDHGGADRAVRSVRLQPVGERGTSRHPVRSVRCIGPTGAPADDALHRSSANLNSQVKGLA